METGFDSVKLVVIVLVVAVQGVAALRGWLKKKQDAKRREEAGLGLPGNREEPQSESAPLPDWDPFEEEDAPEPVVVARQPEQPLSQPPLIAEEQRSSEPLTSVVASTAHSAPSATLHRVIQAQSSNPNRKMKNSLPGGISLRAAMIAKIVFDRPASAPRGNRRHSGL